MTEGHSGRRASRPAVVLAIVLTSLLSGCGSDARATLFTADFGGPDRLLTNEYATYHPRAKGIVRSSQWLVTSGSLFIRSGVATNGRVDHVAPNAQSTNGTNSGTFRAYTRQRFSADYKVTFELRVRRPRKAHGPARVAWDGVHLMVDSASPAAAYYVSLYRRDGFAVIKKKTAGGPIAGGSYRALSQYVPSHIRPDRWIAVRVEVRRSSPEAVTIDLYEGGTLVTTATDDPAIAHSPSYMNGRLGIRADETVFAVKDLVVRRI